MELAESDWVRVAAYRLAEGPKSRRRPSKLSSCFGSALASTSTGLAHGLCKANSVPRPGQHEPELHQLHHHQSRVAPSTINTASTNSSQVPVDELVLQSAHTFGIIDSCSKLGTRCRRVCPRHENRCSHSLLKRLVGSHGN